MPTGRIALRQARLSAGLTQQALADRVGVVRPEIARWEAGGRVPRVDTAVRLARALDTTVEELWAPLTPTPLTPELFIERSEWVFAKTMPHAPHEYTLKDPESRAPAMSPESFEWFVAHVREEGIKGEFGKTAYLYFTVGPWRYWTMGWPVKQTTLINRARIDDRCMACGRILTEFADSHAPDCSRRPPVGSGEPAQNLSPEILRNYGPGQLGLGDD